MAQSRNAGKGPRITQPTPISGARSRGAVNPSTRGAKRPADPAKSFQNGKAQTRPR